MSDIFWLLKSIGASRAGLYDVLNISLHASITNFFAGGNFILCDRLYSSASIISDTGATISLNAAICARMYGGNSRVFFVSIAFLACSNSCLSVIGRSSFCLLQNAITSLSSVSAIK